MRKWGVHQIKPYELRPFEREIERCVEDLDWALQMYSITLEETGMSGEEITRNLRKIFNRSIHKALFNT